MAVNHRQSFCFGSCRRATVFDVWRPVQSSQSSRVMLGDVQWASIQQLQNNVCHRTLDKRTNLKLYPVNTTVQIYDSATFAQHVTQSVQFTSACNYSVDDDVSSLSSRQ